MLAITSDTADGLDVYQTIYLQEIIMSSSADVSVVIPTKQRANLLAAAIASVTSQTLKASAIFVIDDNTTEEEADKTRKVVESFSDHGVVYLKNQRTPGGCGARNTGIINSNTKYVAFLDDDDLWAENKLERQISYLNEFGDCVLFCGYIDRDLSFNQTVVVRPSKASYTLDDFLLGECPTSTTLAIAPKKVLVDAGLFDETLPSLQDFDLWIRCVELSPIRTIPDVLATFIQHRGERVSLNITKRHIAIDRVSEKLSRRYGVKREQLDKLKSQILYNAFVSTAKKHSLFSVTSSWKYALMALRENPLGIKGWKWLAIAPLVRLVKSRQLSD